MGSYNIHPILVHFPIAFLFIYSIIKILPLKKWISSVSWKQIEIILLVVGLLGALAAFATGDTAQHLMHPNRQLVNAHSTFGGISIFIYGIILAGEVLTLFNRKYSALFRVPKWLAKIFSFFEKIVCNTVVTKILAFLGFIAIIMTGLLGGAIVYGASADPLAGIVLKLLGIHT